MSVEGGRLGASWEHEGWVRSWGKGRRLGLAEQRDWDKEPRKDSAENREWMRSPGRETRSESQWEGKEEAD